MAKRKVGRPSKLTPERKRRFLKAIKAGSTREAACGYAGIHIATFARWMEKGRNQDKGHYREFSVAVETCEAEVELMCNARIMTSAQDDPKWAAWWLERRRRRSYAPTQKQEITGGDGGPVKLVYRIGGGDDGKMTDWINPAADDGDTD